MVQAEPKALETAPAPPKARVRPEVGKHGLQKLLFNWPRVTILLVSLVAVAVNCYPVIFCGRSYVSPASVLSLVYDRWPTVPLMETKEPFSPQHGSDVGAMMWWDVPIGFLQARSLLDDGEIPLWNRSSHSGAPLIGQAVSMLGDPLQLIVIFGRGSAIAWDVKFVTAKLIFCVGFGWLILRLLGNKPLAFIYSALAAYCGAFFYIASHPVFFVLAYTPWILLSAIELMEPSCGARFRWWLAWIVANIGCFSAGHVEVAIDLIAGLNLAAVAVALSGCQNTAEMLKVARRMSLAAVLFLGFTAPIWVSFLVTLKGAYSMHQEISVVQYPVQSLPGAFDEAFFRSVAQFGPGTSLLVLVGVIFSAWNWRQFKDQRFFWVNVSAVLVWGGCVFGWIPGSGLALVPLLNRVGHLATDISYLLVIHLTIQSAYGFKSLTNAGSFRIAAKGFLWAILILVALLWKYSFLLQSLPSRWFYLLYAALGAIGAPLLYCYLKSEYRRVPALGAVGILLLGFIPQHRYGLYTFGDKASLMVPGRRFRLDSPSESLGYLKAHQTVPFRVVSVHQGYDGALSGDYAAVYGLEDIRSCAPLGGGEYVKLLTHFPGMTLNHGWGIAVTNLIQAQPLLDLLNVKYVLSNPAAPIPDAPPGLRVIHQSDFVVMENTHVWPRAFFSKQVRLADSTEQFVTELEESERPFVSVTTEEASAIPGLPQMESASSALISPATNYKLSVNSTAFRVHADSQGIVCLAEGQASDFSVKVNNQPRKVLTVNRCFKGVYLDRPGDYEICFNYRPRYWAYSSAAFAISLSGLVLIGARSQFDIPKRAREHCSHSEA